ncbi:predicted protein [Uncinocarpus reesii 1704]|uniref:Uncharacterized protein n=1 Tax=Uncinocarpus reesii (strain UAMH 1704) TaxID=336963 RepID=C4JF10_UNCRE|nr:uncharacterized protein UREG_00911 [Uncinocarpus reesii 1704]EEP76063.1 predicted protein [Uncinocarpus reesii 1704]
MPRPPAKKGRAPRQNALPNAPPAATSNEDERNSSISNNGRRNKRRGTVQETSKYDKITQATPARSNRPIPERQSSARTRRPNQTPVTKQAQSDYGSAASAVAGGHAGRGRFSVGPKRGDASSLLQKMGVGTPAFESSMLSAFRPRPRQHSILQLMADDESSDFGDDEDFLGSFEPEDESTPLHLGKRKTISRGEVILGGGDGSGTCVDDVGRIPGSPTRGDVSLVTASGSPVNIKKRKIMVLVPPPSNRLARREPSPEMESIPNHEIGVEVVEETEHSPSEDDDDLLPPMGRPTREMSPEAWSQTLAPPLSSPTTSPNKSPERPRSHAKSRKKKGKPDSEAKLLVSTAALQANLLPQRRRRRRRLNGNGEFDVFDDNDGSSARSPSPELAPDEDELSYLPIRPGRKASTKKLKENKTALNRLPKRGKRPGAKEKSTDSNERKPSKPSRDGARVTYSRQRPANAEADALSVPEGDVEDAGTEGGRFVSEELVRQSAKFAEVDQWSIDFEDVVVEQGSSYR